MGRVGAVCAVLVAGGAVCPPGAGNGKGIGVKDTILIADDDQVVVAVLSAGLRERGFMVTAAADAMQAMMVARRKPPAAILLDIMMPGGSGFEVFKRLRSNSTLSGIPVVAMSANNDPGVATEGPGVGADAFLLKARATGRGGGHAAPTARNGGSAAPSEPN